MQSYRQLTTPGRRRLRSLSLVVSLGLVAACSGGDDPAISDRGAPATSRPTVVGTGDTSGNDLTWPDPEWEVVEPAAVGLDGAPFTALAASAEQAGSDCLVVVHDGRIVDEHYWQDRVEDERREAWSVTKSITATLVGIAAGDGLIDIDEPVAEYIEAWADTPNERYTIRHFLTQTSGRPTNQEFTAFPTADDQTTFALESVPQGVEPGEEWAYSNSGVQVLAAVVESATGLSLEDFAARELFGPLGMDVELRTDTAGNALAYAGAQTTCRDLARFGLMHLRGGEWDGEQVVPAGWVEEATTPIEANPSYGYLWWLNSEGEVGGTGRGTERRRMMPSASEDAYTARGLGGQLVIVLPEWDAVVVRMATGEGDPDSGFSEDAVAQAVAAALGEAPAVGSPESGGDG